MAFTSVDFIFTLILLLCCVVLSLSRRHCNYVTTSEVTRCDDVNQQEYYDEGAMQCQSCMLCKPALFESELEMSKEDFYRSVLRGGDDCKYKCKEFLYYCIIKKIKEEVATTSKPLQNNNHNAGLLIVAAAGGVVISVIIMFVVVFFFRRKLIVQYIKKIPRYNKDNRKSKGRDQTFFPVCADENENVTNTICDNSLPSTINYQSIADPLSPYRLESFQPHSLDRPLSYAIDEDSVSMFSDKPTTLSPSSSLTSILSETILKENLNGKPRKNSGNFNDNIHITSIEDSFSPTSQSSSDEPSLPSNDQPHAMTPVNASHGNDSDKSKDTLLDSTTSIRLPSSLIKTRNRYQIGSSVAANEKKTTTYTMNENFPLTAVNNPSNSEPLAADTLESMPPYSLNQPLSYTPDEEPTSLFSDSYITSMRHWSRLDSTLSQALNGIPQVVNKELLSLYGNEKLLVISYEGDNIGEARRKINEATNLTDEDYNVRLVDPDTSV